MSVISFVERNDYNRFKEVVATMYDPQVFYRVVTSYLFKAVASSPGWDGKRLEQHVGIEMANGGGSTDPVAKPITFDVDFPNAIGGGPTTTVLVGNGAVNL